MPYESEKHTRKLRIDKQLQSAGWIVIPYSLGMDLSILTNHAVEELPTDNGPADYALFANGVLLGVVEGKKVAVRERKINKLKGRQQYIRLAKWMDIPILSVPHIGSKRMRTFWDSHLSEVKETVDKHL